MRRRKFVGLAGAALVLSVAMAPLAMAQTYSGAAVYKITRSNGTPAVIIANRSAGEKVSVTFPNATATRRVTANACGLVVLRDSSTAPIANLVSVDGAAITQASLPTQLLPRCVNGNLEEARTANFKTGAGEVVIVETPNTVYEAVYSGGRSRDVTANACGFAQINSSDSLDLTSTQYGTFSIGGTSYSLASLPQANPEPLCRSGQLYVPSSW